ncbi:MAG: hypothetical protein KBS95_04840 [Alistipes sp.]|nr:hypothetical protein [Candidatus Alistipes equi]
MSRFCIVTILMLVLSMSTSAREYQTQKTYSCPEAKQGVAVDNNHFYAIANHTIAKYDFDGKKVAEWNEDDENLIKHFDGGIIIDGLLYCSHSNYPDVPMASSIEIFDPKTMKHVRTISFGIDSGSCTWVVRGKDNFYVCFAHYDRNGWKCGGEILKDNSWTQIVEYDKNWQRRQAWILPAELLAELHPNSLSGCIFKDGKFYCTGHDAKKLFILEFPPYGMRMRLTGTIDIPFSGQGIALDNENCLWGIDRKKKRVIKASFVQ